MSEETSSTKAAALLPTHHAVARGYLLHGSLFSREAVGLRIILAPALMAALATSSASEALAFTLATIVDELRERVLDEERDLALDEQLSIPAELKEKTINMGRHKLRHARTAKRVADGLLARAEKLLQWWHKDFDSGWGLPVATTEAATDAEISALFGASGADKSPEASDVLVVLRRLADAAEAAVSSETDMPSHESTMDEFRDSLAEARTIVRNGG